MTYETARRAASYEFTLRSDLPSAAFVFERLLAPFPEVSAVPGSPTYTLTRRTSNGRKFTLDIDGALTQQVDSAGSLVDWLVGDITRKAIAGADGFVAVHAGVVSRNGRAIVLPAEPDSGKTTTVAGLTRAGFSYLSEEVALCHLVTDEVHPFPRPMMMEPGTIDILDGLEEALPAEYGHFRRSLHHVAPDDLRPNAVGSHAPVAFVISPRYRKGSETTLTPMTRAATLFLLADNAFNLERVRSEGLATLRRIAEMAPGYHLDVGDLDAAVDAVIRLVDDHAGDG